MNDTLIAWANDTRNLWWGCKEVNAQCDECYARVFDRRLGGNHWLVRGPRLYQPGVWKSLEKAQKLAASQGALRTQFVQSMGDIFERSLPLVDRKGAPVPNLTTGDLRDRFFSEIVPNSPNLIFLLLTKRPQNIEYMVPSAWLSQPPANVWYGCSVGCGNAKLDQNNIDALLGVPGKHFLSAEPLLAPLTADIDGVKWVIAGGESGPKARPAQLAWFEALRDRCAEKSIAFFFKQTGTVLAKQLGLANHKGETASEWPVDLRVQQFPVW